MKDSGSYDRIAAIIDDDESKNEAKTSDVIGKNGE